MTMQFKINQVIPDENGFVKVIMATASKTVNGVTVEFPVGGHATDDEPTNVLAQNISEKDSVALLKNLAAPKLSDIEQILDEKIAKTVVN